jgi:hypothetical protein
MNSGKCLGSYPQGIGDTFPVLKWPKHETGLSRQNGRGDKNVWIFTYTLPYVFMIYDELI